MLQNDIDARRGKEAIAGGAYTVVERVTAQVSQLIVFVAAARILGPAEFGFFALVSAAAILFLRVAEMGWAQYIMSWAGDNIVPRQVLLLAIISGLLLAGAGALAGASLRLFGFSALTAHLAILFAVWVGLAATSSAQKGMMIWQDKLKFSALSEGVGELAGLLVAMAALLSGQGVLSLVYGRLAFQAVHLLISFSATRLSPLLGLRGAELRKALEFSTQVFLARIGINIRLYAATFIIGGFLGPAAVGYYRAADRLIGALAEITAVPTVVLSWSLFRQTRDRMDGQLSGFQKQAEIFFRILIALSLPVFIWVSVMAQDLVTGLLGTEWLAALPIVALLALSRALMMPGLANEAILSLAGEIRRLYPVTLVYMAIGIVLTLIGAQFGLYGVAWAQVAIAAVILALTIWMQQRYGAINWGTVARGSLRLVVPIAFSAGLLVVLRDAAVAAQLPLIWRLVLPSLATLLAYVAALAAVDADMRRWLRNGLLRGPLRWQSPSTGR